MDMSPSATRRTGCVFTRRPYNAGYASGERALRRVMNDKRFHTELLFPKKTYVYADVAVFYFRTHPPEANLQPALPT